MTIRCPAAPGRARGDRAGADRPNGAAPGPDWPGAAGVADEAGVAGDSDGRIDDRRVRQVDAVDLEAAVRHVCGEHVRQEAAERLTSGAVADVRRTDALAVDVLETEAGQVPAGDLLTVGAVQSRDLGGAVLG